MTDEPTSMHDTDTDTDTASEFPNVWVLFMRFTICERTFAWESLGVYDTLTVARRHLDVHSSTPSVTGGKCEFRIVECAPIPF